jgi:anthranilate phosphoribosyltransferase
MSALQSVIKSVLEGRVPDAVAVEEGMHAIMRGEAEPVLFGGFLVALASRPVEPSHLAAAARAMRAHRVAIHPQVRPLVDTCGTGGDGAGTFNISTAAAMVVAAAGCAVAKHGNRGVSSKVGSADVLEQLGCKLDLTPADACRLIDATGFAFLFAPAFHPAMKHAVPVRRALGVRTIFNMLGPLANPALAEFQLLGVFDPALTETMARTLLELGSKGALVVHCSGLDEIGLHAPTAGHRLKDGKVTPVTIEPESLGIARQPISALAGGDAEANARIIRAALGGGAAACSDIVALNAAAALEVAGHVADLAAGLVLARELMESGAAVAVIDRYSTSSRGTGGTA